MANEKWTEFTAGNPEILVGVEAGDNVQMTVGANKILITDPSGKLSTRLNYKVYTALLTQTSTNAPVVTVLENTLGGNLASVYNNIGNYSLTSAGLFTLNKTLVFIGSANDGDYGAQPNLASARAKDVNEIVIDVVSVGGGSGDDSLLNTSIQIQVYY